MVDVHLVQLPQDGVADIRLAVAEPRKLFVASTKEVRTEEGSGVGSGSGATALSTHVPELTVMSWTETSLA